MYFVCVLYQDKEHAIKVARAIIEKGGVAAVEDSDYKKVWPVEETKSPKTCLQALRDLNEVKPRDFQIMEVFLKKWTKK